MNAHEWLLFLAGIVTSAVVGYFGDKVSAQYLTGHSLRVFAYYRFALAAVVAVLLIVL